MFFENIALYLRMKVFAGEGYYLQELKKNEDGFFVAQELIAKELILLFAAPLFWKENIHIHSIFFVGAEKITFALILKNSLS